MDAAQYLKRQGWRGDGHSLDQSGRGIRRPLLVSKKVDVLGVGLNKHAAVSDQWWMRAFDQGLKDLGTGKRTALADVREKGHLYGGLYGRFVRGEGVAGTFETPTPEDSGVEMRDVKKQKKSKRKHERERERDTEGKSAKRLKSQEHAKKDGGTIDVTAQDKAMVLVGISTEERKVAARVAERRAKAAKKQAKRDQRAARAAAAG